MLSVFSASTRADWLVSWLVGWLVGCLLACLANWLDQRGKTFLGLRTKSEFSRKLFAKWFGWLAKRILQRLELSPVDGTNTLLGIKVP
ncbi:hypothetical protein M0804_008711 [Polistes exclamans]|nr:hypothetical protein M0804_008711 [Polistes exclamans]